VQEDLVITVRARVRSNRFVSMALRLERTCITTTRGQAKDTATLARDFAPVGDRVYRDEDGRHPGALKRSIRYERELAALGGGNLATYVVEAGVSYARFVNDGHRTTSGGWVAAQPFFDNAVELSRFRFPLAMEAALQATFRGPR
jgi:hypothetical protein